MAVRAAVLLSAGEPWNPGVWQSWTIEPDSHGYIALAGDLSDGVQDSASTRTPGYPVILIASGSVSGSPIPVVAIQQIADITTAVLIGLMAKRAGCTRWWAASAVYLLLPASSVASSRILPDTLLALVSASTCLIWLHTHGAERTGSLIARYSAIGLLLSTGALIKPVLLFAPAVYIILALFSRSGALHARILAALAVLAASQAGPLLWRAHNRDAFGLDAISAQDGYEQAGRIWVLTGRATQLEFVTDVKDSVEAVSTVDGEPDYALRGRIYRDMALSEFSAHPAEVLVPHAVSWPRFFSTGIGSTLRYLGLPPDSPLAFPLKAASALLILSLPAGFAAGLIVRRVRRELGPLLALTAAWMAVMSLVHGPLAGPRYGLTFLPVLCATGMSSLCLLLRSRTEAAAGTNGTSAQ
ncbi:MAG: hypothetical protein QUS11_06745 [Candidatus Fermentibacter sp.]|nr:hypothetical protein [Candidatus Fermentibacter sp.]